MHVQSQARARAGSAPAQLTTRPSHPTPDRLAAATARWQAALVDTEGRLEAGLRQQLLHHVVSGGERLDLSGHGEVLKEAPSAVLDEVMAAMADLCAARGEPPTTLVLPPGLQKPPA